MANISLRAYYREVEELIGHGRIDEVIAHCRQMLRYFPKDVTVYRLLAKAYLETQRFSDATDIFQRVLSVVPEDFVSHVGMSIIREDEGNLNAAIWHMERAFEVQPSNSAIRDELRRLFGKRDGMEPPKIRLSRGALARMYAQGNLYQQSIGELRAALADEPSRFDLQALLAKMYLMNGMKVEAAEICNALLTKLPFCLDGNKILAQILAESGRGDEADTYHQRVQMLDPYAAHVSPDSPDTDGVPDNVISLVRLEFDPGQAASEAEAQPGWAASLGINLDEEKPQTSELPSWLDEEHAESDPDEVPTQIETAAEVEPATQADEDSELPASPFFNQEVTDTAMNSQEQLPPDDDSEEPESPETGNLIPDWMKDAGWATADSEEAAEGEVPQTDELDYSSLAEDKPVGEGEIEAAEIPDWLQDMAPPEVKDAAGAPAEDDDQMSGEIPPWLGSRPPGPTDSVVMWLKNKPEDDGETPATGPLSEEDDERLESVEVPDWLQSVAAKMPVAEAAEAAQGPEAVDNNLSGEDAPAPDDGTPSASAEPEAHPDWLGQPSDSEEGTPASIEDTQPTRKAPVSDEAADETVIEPPAPVTPPPTVDMPVETPSAESDQEPVLAEEMPDWLGGEDDELAEPSAESQADEEVPDWLQELEAEVPTVETGSLGKLKTPAADAPEVELPDWLAEAAADEESQGVDDALPFDDLAAEQSETAFEQTEIVDTPTEEVPIGEALDSAPPWMESPEQETPETDSPAQPATELDAAEEEKLPSWMTGAPADDLPAEPTQPVGQDAAYEGAEQDNLPSLEDQDAAIAWLESLAAKQGAAEEELITDPEDRREAPPEWVTESMDDSMDVTPDAEPEALPDQPDWMTDTMMSETIIPEEEAAADEWASETLESDSQREDVPDWVMDTTQTKASEVEDALEEQPAAPQPPQTRELNQDWMLETGLPEQFFDEEEKPAEPVEAGADEGLPPWAQDTLDAVEAEEQAEKPEAAAQEPEIPEWARESIDEEESQPEPEATETLPTPAGTKELNSDWMFETEVPEELFGSERAPEQVSEEAEEEQPTIPGTLSELEASLADEAEAPEPQPAETRELDSEWMLETALPDSLFDEAEPLEMETALPESLFDESETVEEDVLSELQKLVDQAESAEPSPAVEEAAAEDETITAPPISWEPEEEAETPAPMEAHTEPELAPVAAPEEEQEAAYTVLPVEESVYTDETVAAPREDAIPELAAAGEAPSGPDPFEELAGMGKSAFADGNVDQALVHFNKLIRKRKNLDVVIDSLREAVYQHPVDTNILESLGDAYARSNKLQDALDSYTKAEELLR